MDSRCYLITDEATGLSAVVDCGGFTEEVADMFTRQGVGRLEYILLTHGHFDHILGVPALKREYGGQVVIHEDDAVMPEDLVLSLSAAFRLKEAEVFTPDRTVRDGDRIELGESVIEVMHTPGHTKGSVCYIADGVIFSGDTLFHLSIGRTDFPGGSMQDMLESVTRLAQLPGDFTIYPGHGESTTLEEERQNNGYMRNRI